MLDAAIRQLEEEVALLQSQNKGSGPKEDTTDYFILQAKSLGLSLLKHAKQKNLNVDVLRRAKRLVE